MKTSNLKFLAFSILMIVGFSLLAHGLNSHLRDAPEYLKTERYGDNVPRSERITWVRRQDPLPKAKAAVYRFSDNGSLLASGNSPKEFKMTSEGTITSYKRLEEIFVSADGVPVRKVIIRLKKSDPLRKYFGDYTEIITRTGKRISLEDH